MSYASDDLTPLLAQQPAPTVGLRSGIVREWNPVTAENVIEVDGVRVENIGIFNTNEALLLQPGDVVKILTSGTGASSWGILGRFTLPGTPEAASALKMVSSRIVAARDDTMGTRNDAAYGDLTGSGVGPAVTATISSSGKALVFWSADVGAVAWRRIWTGGVSVAVSGATTRAADGAFSMGPFLEHPASGSPGAALTSGGIQCAMMHVFTGLTAGLNTFTLKYRHAAASVGEGPVEFQQREIAVFAL